MSRTATRLAAIGCGLLATSLAASAQLHVFTLDQTASSFIWSASTNLGNVVPTGPSGNMFELTGTVDVALTGTMPTTGAQLLQGDALAVPDIGGSLPNPIPILPPLASIDIIGMRLTAESPAFAVDGMGNFTTDVTVTIISGSIDITALGQTPTTLDLTGNGSLPTPTNGTLTRAGDTITMVAPVSLLFPFTFPSPIGNITGNIGLDGAVVGNAAAIDVTGGFAESCNGDGGDQLGCTDCPCNNNAPQGTIGGCLNSAGTSSRLIGTGTESIGAADLRFEASGVAPSNSCVLTSGNALAPANAANPCFGLNSGIQSVSLDGLRCAVQGVLRHGVRPSDANGDVGATTNGWGMPNGFFQFDVFTSGQTKHFQIIHRDDSAAQCMTGQNTSQAVTVTFGA